MLNKLLMVLVVPCLLTLSSCESDSTGSGGLQNIAFRKTTGNYFYGTNNPVTHAPTFFVITRYSAFDSLFHWAPVVNGLDSERVSADDLQTHFLIDILVQDTFSVDFDIQKITLQSGVLSVYYTMSEPISHPLYTSNNHDLFLVANCTFNTIQLFENNVLLIKPFIDWR